MKKFTYEARDKSNNEVVSSMVQAESETSAAKLLIEQGLMPLNIKEINEDTSFFGKLTNRITTKDKIVFLRQYRHLLGPGCRLPRACIPCLSKRRIKKCSR